VSEQESQTGGMGRVESNAARVTKAEELSIIINSPN
jgi:hypothetical protein